MFNKKIIICTTVKNNAKTLKKIFNIMSDIDKIFANTYIIFIYSESDDNTKNLISEFLEEKTGNLITFNPSEKFNRVKKLELCRNKYLSYIKNNKGFSKYDYLMVLDADNVNNILTIDKIKNSIKKKNWSAIFANQKYFYYDIFALRKKNYLNDSFIKLIKNDLEKNKNKKLNKVAYDNFTKFFYFGKNFDKERFIPVESAFGGFGIYKMKYVLKSKYQSYGGKVCEHVSFNKKIFSLDKNVFVDKNLINSLGINSHVINGLLCSQFTYFAKRFFRKLKLIK